MYSIAYTVLTVIIMLNRFNVDCDASPTFYSLNLGLFTSSDESACPIISPLPLNNCQGKESTCWSPGQKDRDCPDNGLCCFNGCSNTCTNTPSKPKVTLGTTPGYEYPTPAVTLPLTTSRPTFTSPPSLYGQPPRTG